MAERWSRRPCASSMPMSAIKAVHASRGKVVRAQPVAALYERSRIHHVGAFPSLEDQMCAFTTDFDRAAAGFSPDRVDALVWAFSELMVEPMAGQGFYDLAREQAEAFEARKAQAEEAARIIPVYAVGSLEYAEQQRRIAEGRE